MIPAPWNLNQRNTRVSELAIRGFLNRCSLTITPIIDPKTYA